MSSASPYLGPRIDESPPVGLFEKLIDPPPALRGNANGRARLFYRVMRSPSTTLPTLLPPLSNGNLAAERWTRTYLISSCVIPFVSFPIYCNTPLLACWRIFLESLVLGLDTSSTSISTSIDRTNERTGINVKIIHWLFTFSIDCPILIW